MDVHDKKTRSFNMSRIKDRDTKPEVKVRSLCHHLGLRFRLHHKDLPGKPDLVFPKYNTVIFVHGCYWHSHSCKYGSVKPKTNAEFWQDKRNRTIERDQKNTENLKALGWNVLIYWECEIKSTEETLLERIRTDFNL